MTEGKSILLLFLTYYKHILMFKYNTENIHDKMKN